MIFATSKYQQCFIPLFRLAHVCRALSQIQQRSCSFSGGKAVAGSRTLFAKTIWLRSRISGSASIT